jgi:hypothetical protein
MLHESTTMPEQRRGLLVPVSNPEDVAALIAIATAASATDEPPPWVITLVPRGASNRTQIAPADLGGAPVPPALQAAIDYATGLDPLS